MKFLISVCRFKASVLLAGFFAAAFMPDAWGQCYRITAASTNPAANNYIEPGVGTAADWEGARDDAGRLNSIAKVINLNSSSFQPDGTLLASAYVSLNELAYESAGYQPEQILFRCQPTDGDALFEYYATNGDNNYAGRYEDGISFGLPEAYRTRYKGMLIRIRNAKSGEYFSRYWKARQLTNVARDSLGWYLVKAKDFSGVNVELFRVNSETIAGNTALTTTGLYSYSQPSGYIGFKGPGFSAALQVGADSLNNYSGWYSSWPGSVNLYQQITIRRSASCDINLVTPSVLFPTASIVSLEGGAALSDTVYADFSCNTGAPASTGVAAFASGTSAGQTAIGIMPSPANYQAAKLLGLGTAGLGITYLLSDGYANDPTVANGVGVQFYSVGPINLLKDDVAYGGGAADGWYPVLNGASQISLIGGITKYRSKWTVVFKKIPGEVVTPGKFKATVQVIIRVQ